MAACKASLHLEAERQETSARIACLERQAPSTRTARLTPEREDLRWTLPQSHQKAA